MPHLESCKTLGAALAAIHDRGSAGFVRASSLILQFATIVHGKFAATWIGGLNQRALDSNLESRSESFED